ncbi:MAG: CDP-alcohol phosphatidyltransferase family protein [Hyphomicrobiaceae bacterium]
MIISIPNVITLGRIILVPVIFWLLIIGSMQAAFIAFVCAGLSDAVDGYLAKRFNLQTELGSYLDPMADKLLIASVYIALGVAAKLPSWLVIAVVSRDILIVIGVLLVWMMGNPIVIRPLPVSKANTLAQIVLAATVLADEGFSLGMGVFRELLVWITGTLTVLSLAYYLREWVALMAGSAPGPGPGPR